MPAPEYIAHKTLTLAGGRPQAPLIDSWMTSPWTRAMSSVPASSIGTFSVLPLVLTGSMAIAGSTDCTALMKASP